MLVAKKPRSSIPYYEQQQQKRKSVERRANSSRLAVKKLTILCVLLLITLSALSLVAHFVLVVQVNYEIGRATRELLSMQEQQQQLKIEIAALRSPERLEKIALEEIGLHYPTHSQLIVLTAGNLEVGD